MSDETLTEDEIRALQRMPGMHADMLAIEKALRIIDAANARAEAAERNTAEQFNLKCAAVREAHDREWMQRDRANQAGSELKLLRETDVHRARVWAETGSHLAAANALLERCIVAAIRAHLAAQPATAPTTVEADDDGCECPGAHECGVTTSTAANERRARTEAEPSLWCDNCEEPMESEGDNPAGVCAVCWGSYQADKAVLDALAAVPDAELRMAIESPRTSYEITEFARAELARRGLKP